MASMLEQAAQEMGKFSRTEQAAGGIASLINPALLLFAGGGLFLYFHGRNRHREAENIRLGQIPIPQKALRRLQKA